MNNFPIIISAGLFFFAVNAYSLILNLRLIRHRKTLLALPNQIPANSLTSLDIFIIIATTVLAHFLNYNLSCKFPFILSVLLFLPLICLIPISATIVLYRRHNISAFNYWGFSLAQIPHHLKTGLKSFLISILPLNLIFLPIAGLCLLFKIHFSQPQIDQFRSLHKPSEIATYLFLATIVAPFWEEITFRGVLYPFLKKYVPTGWAMFLSSFVWAASHLHWPVLLPFTFFGCTLCLIYEKTGKLGNTIAFHAIYNLIILLSLLFLNHYGLYQTF